MEVNCSCGENVYSLGVGKLLSRETNCLGSQSSNVGIW